MITELRAHNFKSWQATGEIRFAPLTGFFGANNSGKSSILQILLLLKQTTEQPPEWNEPLYYGNAESLVNLHGFDDIIHHPIKVPSLSISVSWQLPKDVTILSQANLDVLSFYFNLFNTRVGRLTYQVGEHEFGIETESGRHVFKASTRPDHWEGANLFRCYGFRFHPSNTSGKLSDLEEAFEELFSRVHYLGPRRVDPRHDYTWEGDHPEDVGQYGEKTIPALLSGRILRRSIEDDILKRLQRLELIDSYDVLPVSAAGKNYDFLVRQYKDGPEVGLTDVGFGVSQILPLITQCYCVPEGSILILENPEAHLHPKVQSELADVFIDVVKNRNIQIILESHSEHLLHRLTRRIAEGEECKEGISVDKTAFHFCEIKDGISTAKQLEVDTYGRISNWPKDFFGDDVGDLVEKTKAEMKRRKEDK